MMQQFLKKFNAELAYDPGVPSLYPKEIKTYIHTKTCNRYL